MSTYALNVAKQAMLAQAHKIGQISKNIANMHTTGYSASETLFSTILGGGVKQMDRQFVTKTGSFMMTGSLTDVAIAGSGLFAVQDNRGDVAYSRDGSFKLSVNPLNVEQGFLTHSSGARVLGYPVNAEGIVNQEVSEAVVFDYGESDLTQSQATKTVDVKGNINSNERVNRLGGVKVWDNNNNSQTLSFLFSRTSQTNVWNSEIYMEGSAVPVHSQEVRFIADGSMDTETWKFNANIPFPEGDSPIEFTMKDVTQFAGVNYQHLIVQDGVPPGMLVDVKISKDGGVNANYSNGYSRKMYELVMGDFVSYNNLRIASGNLYYPTRESGAVDLSRVGDKEGRSLEIGSLEMSNVDLAYEFSAMIMTQRAYSTAASIITTTDEMLQKVVQIKR